MKSKWTTKRVVFKGLTPEIVRKSAEIIDSKFHISLIQVGLRFKIAVRHRSNQSDEIEFLYLHFGGYKYRQLKDGKPIYWLNFQQRRAYKLLREIYPHMTEQKKVVREIFNMEDLIKKNKKRRLTEEVLAERQVLLEKIKALNKARFAH